MHGQGTMTSRAVEDGPNQTRLEAPSRRGGCGNGAAGACQAAPDESKSGSRSEEGARGRPRAGQLSVGAICGVHRRRRPWERVEGAAANQTAHVRGSSQSLATLRAYSYLAENITSRSANRRFLSDYARWTCTCTFGESVRPRSLILMPRLQHTPWMLLKTSRLFQGLGTPDKLCQASAFMRQNVLFRPERHIPPRCEREHGTRETCATTPTCRVVSCRVRDISSA